MTATRPISTTRLSKPSKPYCPPTTPDDLFDNTAGYDDETGVQLANGLT